MSIQSEITRINNNVQSTLNTIADTGVSVGTNSDALPAAASALANEKLSLSGGMMTGPVKFQDSSLPEKTLQYICGIDAFAIGGEMGWQSKTDVLIEYAKKTDIPVSSVNGKTGAVQLGASDVGALPLSGGTLTGETIINTSSKGYEGYTGQSALTILHTGMRSDADLVDMATFSVYEPSPFGLIFRVAGTGTASIQSQRINSETERFTLSLNPYGGKVYINGVEAATKDYVDAKVASAGGGAEAMTVAQIRAICT